MRRARMLATMIAATISLGGCYVSLHPLVTDDVRVFEPRLVGTWESKGDKADTWTFRPAGGESPSRYDIEIVDDGHAAQFSGELARFDGLLVLDLKLGDNEQQCGSLDNDWFQMHVVGVHSFMRVGLDGDNLTLNLLDGDWLDEAIEAKKMVIAHEHVDDNHNPHEAGGQDVHGSDDRKLLTAPTRELQALVRTFGKAGLFDADEAGDFTRRR